VMDTPKIRQIFLHGPLGKRQLREVLSSQLSALLIQPEPIWLVSPWVSDFLLLDNRAGQWNALNPDWTGRKILFSELLAELVNQGCNFNLVTRDLPENKEFIVSFKEKLSAGAKYKIIFAPEVHSKGFLTSKFFFEGSMNFTFSGAYRNDELVKLKVDNDAISEALIEFKERYNVSDDWEEDL